MKRWGINTTKWALNWEASGLNDIEWIRVRLGKCSVFTTTIILVLRWQTEGGHCWGTVDANMKCAETTGFGIKIIDYIDKSIGLLCTYWINGYWAYKQENWRVTTNLQIIKFQFFGGLLRLHELGNSISVVLHS